jgi:hypothetical protein
VFLLAYVNNILKEWKFIGIDMPSL